MEIYLQERRKFVTRLQEQVVRSLQTSSGEGPVSESMKIVVCSLAFEVWRTACELVVYSEPRAAQKKKILIISMYFII